MTTLTDILVQLTDLEEQLYVDYINFFSNMACPWAASM